MYIFDLLKLGDLEIIKQGGIWTFKLQVDLPVHIHDSLVPTSNQVEDEFRTVLMQGKPRCLCNVEIFIDRAGATRYAAQTTGSVLFDIQGYIQAENQVNGKMLQNWLAHAEWTRIRTRLEKDITYNAVMTDNNLKRVQVHGEPKNKPAGRPRKVNTDKYSKVTVDTMKKSEIFLELRK